MDKNLLSYIESAKAQGLTREQIDNQLLLAGWDNKIIEEALEQYFPLTMPASEVVVPVTPTYTIDQIADENNFAQIEKNTPEPFFQPVFNPEGAVKFSTAETPAVISSEHHPFRTMFKILSVVAVLVLVFAGIFVVVSRFSSQQKASSSTAKITSENTNDSKTQTYTNYKYNFEVKVPSDWARKEYPPEEFGGEARFAFGLPENLPKEFFNDGDYVWLRVFSSEDATERADYEYFQTQLTKDIYKSSLLGGQPAIDNGVVVMCEHKGFVYSLYLTTLTDSDGTRIYTPTANQIWESFKFLD